MSLHSRVFDQYRGGEEGRETTDVDVVRVKTGAVRRRASEIRRGTCGRGDGY